MGCEGRKVYVEVNVTHRADGSARPKYAIIPMCRDRTL